MGTLTARLLVGLTCGAGFAVAGAPPGRGMSVPVPPGESVRLLSQGQVGGYSVSTLRGPTALLRVTGIAVLDRKVLVGTKTGLFIWDLTTSRLMRKRLFGFDAEPIATIFGADGTVLFTRKRVGTLRWKDDYRRAIQLAGGGYRDAEGIGRANGSRVDISDTLRALVAGSGLIFGAWEKEGVLRSRDDGQTWQPLASLPEGVAAASPTCMTMTASGQIACGFTGKDRGFVAVSTDWADRWTLIPDFRNKTTSLLFIGETKLLAGLKPRGATLIDLEEKRSQAAPQLARYGRIADLYRGKDRRIACATEEGLVIVTSTLTKVVHLTRRDGLAGDSVRSITPCSTYGREELLLLVCEGRRGTTGISTITRPR